MALQDAFNGGPDLLAPLESSAGHAPLHFFQAFTRPPHRLHAHARFVGPTLVAVDHEHAHARTITRHLLHARPRTVGGLFLADVNADRAVEPAVLAHAIDQRLRFRILAARHADQK